MFIRGCCFARRGGYGLLLPVVHSSSPPCSRISLACDEKRYERTASLPIGSSPHPVTVVVDSFPELEGWSPWVFAGPQETQARLEATGFTSVRCWLEERPTRPDDLAEFVRSSILPAHMARLPEQRREPFAAAVVDRVREPIDYVRLNISAIRG
jgi:hypothetical protein